MKAIILICQDGARHLAFVVNVSFDTQAWAQARVVAFKFLRVIRVEEHLA